MWKTCCDTGRNPAGIEECVWALFAVKQNLVCRESSPLANRFFSKRILRDCIFQADPLSSRICEGIFKVDYLTFLVSIATCLCPVYSRRRFWPARSHNSSCGYSFNFFFFFLTCLGGRGTFWKIMIGLTLNWPFALEEVVVAVETLKSGLDVGGSSLPEITYRTGVASGEPRQSLCPSHVLVVLLTRCNRQCPHFISSVCVSVSLPLWACPLFVYVCHLSVSVCVCLFVAYVLSVYFSLCPWYICLSVCLSVSLSACLSLFKYGICRSIHQKEYHLQVLSCLNFQNIYMHLL